MLSALVASLTLNVAMLTMLLHLNKFGLGSLADFSDAGVKPLINRTCSVLTSVKNDAALTDGLN